MARRSWGLGKRRQARLGDTDYDEVIGEYGSSISPSGVGSGESPFGVADDGSDSTAPNPYLPAKPPKGRAARQAARAAKQAPSSGGGGTRTSERSPFEAPASSEVPANPRTAAKPQESRRTSAHAPAPVSPPPPEPFVVGRANDSRRRRRPLRPGQILGLLSVALISPAILLFANQADRIVDPGPINPGPSDLVDAQPVWSFDLDDFNASRQGLAGSDERFQSVYVSQGVVIARFDASRVDGTTPSTVVGVDQVTGELRWSFELDDARCAAPHLNVSGSAAPTADGQPGTELVCTGTRSGQTVLEVREVATGEVRAERLLDFPQVTGLNVTSTGIQALGSVDSRTGSMELGWFDLAGAPVWRVDLAAIVPSDQFAYDDNGFSAMPLRWYALDDDRVIVEVGDAIFHLDSARAASLGDCRQPATSQGLFLCPSDRGFEARGADGELVWTNEMAGMFIEESWGDSAPVVSDYAEPRGAVSTIDWATGELGIVLVEFADAPYLIRMGSPEAGFVSGGRDLLGLSADGKSVAWLAQLPVDYVTSANLVGDKVVVDAESKGVYVLDPATGDEISRWSIKDRLAAIAGDSMVTIGPYEGVSLVSFD